jgi:C1A family cysteine protease
MKQFVVKEKIMCKKTKPKRTSKAVAIAVVLAMLFGFSVPAFAENGSANAAALDEVTLVMPEMNDISASASGFIDPGIDFSEVNDYSYTAADTAKNGWLRATALPASFSWRDENPNMLTAVRDQSPYQTCWAHASLASLTSSLVKNGVTSSSVPLSPRQLAYAVFNTDTFNNSNYTPLESFGSYMIAATAMSKWFGPVTEANAPYSQDLSANLKSMPASYYEASDYHLEDMYIFPAPYDSAGNFKRDNVDTVKAALMTYGLLGISYYSSGSYNPPNYAYYTSVSRATDHAVTIVGWDDSVSKSLFAAQPPGDGAWLIQNSYGTSWGNDGYFWLSYYDRTISNSYYFSAGAKNNYDEIVYYDELGWTGTSIIYQGRNLYAANIFKTDNGEGKELMGAAFYTNAPGLTYEISAYADPTPGNPSSGAKIDIAVGSATTITGAAAFAGYHTVDFSNTFTFSDEDTYSVIVKFTDPSGQDMSSIPVEHRLYRGSHLTLLEGQSFIGNTGTSWEDVKTICDRNGWDGMGNVNVRALLNDPLNDSPDNPPADPPKDEPSNDPPVDPPNDPPKEPDKEDVVTGWQTSADGVKKYFVDGTAVTGLQTIGGKRYYFDENGAMLTGWRQISGKWYYLGADGVIKTGWQASGGKWYYLAGNGVMLTGWQKSGAKWYYFAGSGAMLTGWQKSGGKWYYLDSSGAMRTGWQKINKKWYYLGTDGKMRTGTVKIGGKTYRFNSSGAMIT